ncbi:MAG: metalloregulator ArsR/SmtB family transcription factor [Candidatus Bathyarchaeota archaeon]|nr:metalloregulator ArsR/SmtB family transcription factor [Candidatus Bathyarchaeota archaeon]MDH5790700.1 metalloregulator ArsR/SmtB family transcription factor [Candidatus Bathyarchaeota archaeon]
MSEGSGLDMPKDIAREELSGMLETYFCDAEDVEAHESLLRKLTDEYLRNFDFKGRARLFNALSEESRLKILALLTFREMCVCELTAALDMTQPNLTYHVKKLENVGLVEHKKQGKWVYYSLTDEKYVHQFEMV